VTEDAVAGKGALKYHYAGPLDESQTLASEGGVSGDDSSATPTTSRAARVAGEH
jgi:hypothetical protein